jgi:DinB superfamily
MSFSEGFECTVIHPEAVLFSALSTAPAHVAHSAVHSGENVMRLLGRPSTLVALLLVLTLPLCAQDREGVMGDLIRDVTRVEAKIVGLARAMPASAYEWKPGNGARSTGEVFIHVAADNYFMPVLMGVAAPAETGIDAKGKHKTVEAFENRTMARDQIIAELEKSFKFLKQAMTDTPDAKLEEQPKFESRKITTRGLWIATAAHLHEHLGQLIAYARSNNVPPPWSK